MSKIEFTPQLIQRDDAAINEQIEKLEKAAFKLKQLGNAWETQFKETFGLPQFRQLPRPDDNLIDRHLKLTYIRKHPVLSQIYGPGATNVKEALQPDKTDFPGFGELPNTISTSLKFVTKNISGKWLNQLFENGLAVSENMKKTIIEENSHFTQNMQQNFVLELCRNFAKNVNLINNMGGFFSHKNIPAAISGCFTVIKTSKKYSEFISRHGQGHYFIEQFVPGHTLKGSHNSIYSLFENFTDEQIAEMYKELTSNK